MGEDLSSEQAVWVKTGEVTTAGNQKKWVSREGQHMMAGAWALEQRKGSRQESRMLEVDLEDIQCPGKG